MYKTARLSSIKNGPPPIIFPDEGGEVDLNKSDNTVNMGKTNNNKKTFTSNNLKFDKSSKHKRSSVVNRIREKTMGVKYKLHEQMMQDESHILQTTQKFWIHFSPQIMLWFCRFAIFIWAYAYHDYQSWFMLLWVMHSTLFKSTRRFIYISITYYFPIFVLILLFYYVINIPRVVEFQKFGRVD